MALNNDSFKNKRTVINGKCGHNKKRRGMNEEMEESRKECSKCERKKKRSEKEFKDLMNRLKRIEGQVRGVQNMLERDAYCVDIITQVSAINAALSSFSRELLNNHLHSCVADNIRNGNDEVIDELGELLKKLMK